MHMFFLNFLYIHASISIPRYFRCESLSALTPPLHLRILDSSIPSRLQHGSASQCRLYLQVSIANHILNHFFNLFLGEVLGKLLELLF